MRGQRGHGLLAARSAGGWGSNSKFTRLSQPCLSDVPIQSVPVSPPPMTMTFLPLADIYWPSSRFESRRLFVLAVKNSIARWTPGPSLPGIGRSLASVAPVASSTESKDSSSECTLSSTPMSQLTRNSIPSSRMICTRRSTVSLSNFMLGMPYMRRPPIRSARSNTVTW